MTGIGWLALATALLLAGMPAGVPARVAGLTGRGRLAVGRARHRRTGERLPAAALRPAARSLGATAAPIAGGCGVLLGAAAVPGLRPLWLAGGAAGWAGWRLSRALAIRRRRLRRRAQLRIAVGVLVGELEAGGRPAVALAAAAEAAPDLADVLGSAAAAALAAGDAAEALIGDPSTAALGHAWRLGEDTGAALSGVLGRVADDLAGRDAQHRAVAVALSGPRSSALVLAGLPVLGLLLGVAMGARPDRFLLDTPGGRWVCCTGVLLDILGLLWLAAILRKAEQT